MKYVNIQDKQDRPLPFYLAMEEYLAKNLDDEELWFMWVVSPTVIVGRNQILDREVDLAYCRNHGIDVCRRKSGGGCVYADRNNVMFSYISRSSNVSTTFTRYTSGIVTMLKGLGLDASATGRNDILVNGLKVSGSAFYHMPDRSIVHGTMLYDTDFDNMSHAIRPPVDKLRVHGVQSVPQRITTLKPLIPHSLNDFMEYAKRSMSTGEYDLTDNDICNIEQIMAGYLKPDWIEGRKRVPATLHNRVRIDGVGTVEVNAVVTDRYISDFQLFGDFFPLADLDWLCRKLTGVAYDREAVESVLDGTDMGSYIAGLNKETFLNLIF